MIEVVNLWKRYKNIDVLKGLHFEAKPKEIVVILGRSGVGKSVLLRHILGIEKPDLGTIRIQGTEISLRNRKELYPILKNMGMLFQGAALFDSMTIEENTAFYLQQHGNPLTKKPFSKEEIDEKVQHALSMVGLEGTGKRLPADLSGGMRKRAALARLIVYRPSTLLYDEPTTGLDPITAEQISQLILETQKELQGTSIVVTHDIHSALLVADKIALHKEGKLWYLSPPEEFLQIDDPMINFLRKNIKEYKRTPSS